MNIPTTPTGVARIKDPILRDTFRSLWSQLSRAVNGKMSFGTPQDTSDKKSGNLDGVWPGTISGQYTITTPAGPNTEFTVTHNLGRIPTGYDVKSKDAAAIIYDSRKALWTTTQMFLKCNQASVNLVLFVH